MKAVLVVHNETSTGATTRLLEVRRAIDRVHHPALLLVDAVSSLASIEMRQDEWGIDVVVAGSQKGLMLPPGLSFNAVGPKALAAAGQARLTKSYWAWAPIIAANAQGVYGYTPSTNLLFGLREALRMLDEEGLDRVFARHRRLAAAARAAVTAWGLEILCRRADEQSPVVTAVVMPDGHNADSLRRLVAERLGLTLGAGLGRLAGTVFRIGHLADFNELMLMGTLSGIELGLSLGRVPFTRGGVDAALDSLLSEQA